LSRAEKSANAENSAGTLAARSSFSETYARSMTCTVSFSIAAKEVRMTLKIEKEFFGQKTVVRLSGRLQAEHVDELKTQLTGEPSGMALDLEAVTLVDVEVVRFFNACEQNGVELLHCCRYIREWILRERNREE
jgi:hypothetical protein